ncbi:Signal transduction histidine kinase [Nannocystis exedens]|uniref:histidine kinase n=1 Tax=Nannocystis exedens TaxID=54 RepID=A0A1I2GMU1_9BACT|nr:CHASE domain-containing protein [Nannocystis exedens]PCC73646.1 hybrid sensor histidine kinase/response regulator [Nannocystis exedens]SFF18329.1 Signal transduction histidine kinase [Nannocystis exedens]
MSLRPSLSAWLPFSLCLVLTAAAAVLVSHAERQVERARLASAVLAARDRIVERMAIYISVLRGSSGWPAREQPVTVSEFGRFVERLKLADQYPGTQGIGYTARFGAVELHEAVALARARGWHHVQIWPEWPRDEVHAIVLLEPLDLRNRAAMGFDMRTERTRREAMDRARDIGDVALSGKVTLVQEIDEHDQQAGFLLYSPVYVDGGVPASVAERREKLKGYVYAPLRAGDLIEGIFAEALPAVAFELYDGEGVDAERLLYRFGRRIAGDDDDAILEMVEIAGHPWTVRFARAAHGPNGSPLTSLVTGLGAALSAVVLIVTRVREQARARALTRARAEAQANQEMLRFTDLFIGILGHDLRTPLSAIVLCAELLRRADGQTDTTEAFERLRASARRMSRMIDQLLDLTRVRLGGGIAVLARPVALDAVVRDVVDELVRAGPDARIEVATTGDLGGRWDPDRLAQVFSNLLGNAVRHREGAPVRVRLDGSARDRVVASVHNAGVIAPALRPVVFEPFRGAQARPAGGASGLGLGLYITRAIVEAHGGSVTVAAAEGAGTTFTVILPRTARVARAKVAAAPGRATDS